MSTGKITDKLDETGGLSEPERLGMLRVFDELVPKIPGRSKRGVDRELAGIRSARQAGRRLPQSGR